VCHCCHFLIKYFHIVDIYWNVFKYLLGTLCAIVAIFYVWFKALVTKAFSIQYNVPYSFQSVHVDEWVLTCRCELDPIIVAAMLSILLPYSHRINASQLLSTRHCRINGYFRPHERLDELLILNGPRYWFVRFVTSHLLPSSFRLIWYLFIYCDNCNTDFD